MFYFLYGDISKAAKKANQMAEALLKKQPDANRFKLDIDNFSRIKIQEFLDGQGLFSNKYIVDLRRFFEDENIKKEIFDLIKELKDSQNIFIWTEGNVKKDDLKKIEKYAEKIQFFDIVQNKNKKPEFNIFSLGDAFGERNKKKLWTAYLDALNYFAIEEIHGTLFWQLKIMLLAIKSVSAKDADLKPFVFNKAKTFAKNYSEEELEKLSLKLISISHDAKRGKCDFEIVLERFCLEI